MRRFEDVGMQSIIVASVFGPPCMGAVAQLPQKLSWNAHIAHIEEKCKKRLNLMRMLSGQTWKASKSSLLTRAYIQNVNTLSLRLRIDCI